MQKRTRSISQPARPDASPQGERFLRMVARKNTQDLRPGAMQIMLKILCKRATEAHATPKNKLWKEMAAAFEILHPGHGVANVERTMFERLFEKVCATGEICDRPKSGRPGLVTDEQVRMCNMYFKRGIGNTVRLHQLCARSQQVRGDHKDYRGVQDCARHPVAAHAAGATG